MNEPNFGGSTMSERYEVLSPLGDAQLGQRLGAARLDKLQGKTICEVSNGFMFRADETFPIIRDLLGARYPELRIVPHGEVPTVELQALVPETKAAKLHDLRTALGRLRCDAVIAQFAG
jgi:hypothetical protein